jgi:hypothetical protein
MAMTNVFTGSNGTLTLANENTPEGADAKQITDAYEVQTVGRVTDVELHVITDLEEFHEIGRRLPTSLHPGDVHISGRVGRAYVNGALLYLLLGRGASASNLPEPFVHPTFNISLRLNDPATPGNSATIELKGVKFQSWSLTLPEQDFVMENLPFRALAISVLDKAAPAGAGEPTAIAPAFPGAATA